MPDQDKDAVEMGEPEEFMPGEDEFEDEFEGEEEEALEEAPVGARTEGKAEADRAGRRSRLGRGGEEHEHAPGSLRASHERVRVDDRLSAIFVIVCAVGLLGILIGGFAAQYMPKGSGRTAPPLDLRTFVPTPSVSASASASGSASLAPTATPSPTASPSAS